MSYLVPRLALIAAMIIVHTSPVRAHHSWAPYYMDAEVTLEWRSV